MQRRKRFLIGGLVSIGALAYIMSRRHAGGDGLFQDAFGAQSRRSSYQDEFLRSRRHGGEGSLRADLKTDLPIRAERRHGVVPRLF